jgi:hypothetical protein
MTTYGIIVIVCYIAGGLLYNILASKSIRRASYLHSVLSHRLAIMFMWPVYLILDAVSQLEKLECMKPLDRSKK